MTDDREPGGQPPYRPEDYPPPTAGVAPPQPGPYGRGAGEPRYYPCPEPPCDERSVASRSPVRTGGVLAAAVLGGILGAALLAGALALFGVLSFEGLADGPGGQTGGSASKPVVITPSDDVSPVEAVAAKVTPSVVNIAVRATNAFGRVSSGNGSGVVIREDGYILTNNHVVEGADEVLVRLGREDLPAKVVGTDPSTDLAVVKIERTGLPKADIGDSSTLKVGELVVAVGSPFGLDKTVTSGIVSALNRASVQRGQTSITTYTNLIQTDAPINPGNSGGALANEKGQVVGINTLIQTGGAEQSAGIGFAIPIRFAMDVAGQLIDTGKATHPFMGLSMLSVDEQLAAQYSLPVDSGVLVQEVVTGSPAETAGVQRGDIIVKIGDADVADVDEAFQAIRSHRIGETTDVVLYRGSERTTVKVTLGADTQQSR